MKTFNRLIILFILLALIPIVGKSANLKASAAEPFHDSRDPLYRSPFGAVPTGTAITLRLRTPADTAESVTLRVLDQNANEQQLYQMSKAASTPEDFDYWEATLKTPDSPTLLWYRFILRQGDKATFYEDDTRDDAGNYHWERKGGPGITLDESKDQSWQITVYTPDFTTPQWMHDAVVYQIFPDRFRNGDKSNDPKDGSEMFYGNLPLKFHSTWNEKVEDPRSDPGGQFNRDFFGGDLKGIEEKLPYLKDLGITAIYLNPIFEARSNHRYDTADYSKIDPILGTQADWDSLAKAADAQGIHLILDGVFNHVSSDSIYFDRYHRFDTAGACEDVTSKFRSWFYFRAPTKQDAVPNACVDDGKGQTAYDSWAGFDTIPRLNSTNIQVRRYIYGSDNSIARMWLNAGASGWRLDVGNEIDDGSSTNPYWEEFRQEVRRANPDAVIIGEMWDNASLWLTGTQWDSVMNYRLRNAVLPFTILKPFHDDDVNWQPIPPSKFDALLMAELEDYPPQAMDAMMNLLDSHDTSRVLYVTGDRQSQEFAAFLQFMLPGAPTIYYGDEIGLNAQDVQDQDDPYNRAPYPWADEKGNFYGPPDAATFAFYKKLTQIRAAHPSLRDGSYRTLLADDQTGLYAFLRTSEGDSALVITNHTDKDQSATLDVQGIFPEGATLTDALSGGTVTVKDSKITATLTARTGVVYTLAQGAANALPVDLLSAKSGDGTVELNWPVRNALVKYNIYRSFFPVGGFTKLNDKPLDDTGAYTDSAVSNGTRYYYYVDVLDDKNLIQQRSQVTVAGPGAPIKAAQIVPPSGAQTISAPLSIQGVTVSAQVTIESDKPQHVSAQIALTEPNTDPKTISVWQPMKASSAGMYTALLRPNKAGDYQVVARFSTDGGLNWTYTQPAGVSIAPPASTTPPVSPDDIKVTKATLFNVTLTWNTVPGAVAYRVYRGVGRNKVLLTETTSTTFRDVDAVEGATYLYTITSVDASLNESSPSKVIDAQVKRQLIAVTFQVTVPADTPPNSPVFIAGDFGSKEYPSWNPGALQMTDKGSNVWEITLNLQAGASIQYKYARGTWDAVEKDASCAEIANRTLNVKEGLKPVQDVVAKWRDIAKCG